MAGKEFIFQGFTPRTHVEAVRSLFELPNIRKVLISVAFVSRNGVNLIAENLQANSGVATVFAGIRNDITSLQGLEMLLTAGVTLRTVDTGARGVLFHPKIYLVRNDHRARLIVGSANLTLGGLNNNIEAGLILDCDLTDPTDKALVDSVETQFNTLPTSHADHVQHIQTAAELKTMYEQGRLIDELAAAPPRAISAKKSGTGDGLKRIRLAVTPLRPTFIRPRRAVAIPPAAPVTSPTVQPIPAAIGVEFEEVWASKPLTERDLNIPRAIDTHATGSMNLDKGQLPDDVDHRHYFKDEVFQSLAWASRSATVDEATATFQLVVKGVSYGEFALSIRHTNSTDSAAYLQRNAMTRLSWGIMREYVAKRELIDRILTLYRDKADPSRFTLEID